MKNLSPLQKLSGCIIAINLFAINLFILIFSVIEKNKEEDLFIEFKPFPKKSQMCKILDENSVRVAIQDNQAYWVVDNILYKAGIDEEGRIINDDAQKVDVFNMSEKQVSNLLSIIDNINS